MSDAFDGKHGPVYVRGEISGPTGQANVLFVLDTGATNRLIRTAILRSIEYDHDASDDVVQVAMGSGVENVPRVALTRLTALGRHRIGSAVLPHGLPPEAVVDGLLGLDFFRGHILTLDFQAGLISLA